MNTRSLYPKILIMKTKLNFVLILCSCLIVAFNSCQKEIANPTQVVAFSITETDKLIGDLVKDLPNNVFIEPVSDEAIDTRSIPFPFPTDVPVSCRHANCFQLIDTYEDLQLIANNTCGLIQRNICCCIKGYYRCFIIGVLPNIICPDTLKTLPTDIIIIDERVPINFEKQ